MRAILSENNFYDNAFYRKIFRVAVKNIGQALYKIGTDEAKKVRYALEYMGKDLRLYKVPKTYENADKWFMAVTQEDVDALDQI